MSFTLHTWDDRVFAVDDADGQEICGAFNPVGHRHWQLYVTRKVADLTGLRTPPHREHFWGDHGRADALAWIELIATLYDQAVQAQAVTK